MKQSEFVRWLTGHGATFKDGTKHLKVYCNGEMTMLPRHPSKELNPDNPLARHSGAGRNPARKILREADNTAMLSRFRGELLTIWIPAFAGMTQFFLMDYLG